MSIGMVLLGHELFRTFESADVDRITGFSVLHHCSTRDYIYRAGDTCTHVYLLVEGRIQLRLPSGQAFNVVISEIGPGELFGLSPLLGAHRQTLIAQCATNCEVVAIEAAPLHELLTTRCADVGIQFMRSVAQAYFDRYLDIMKRWQTIVDQIPLIPQ